jgi:hypothetical protein
VSLVNVGCLFQTLYLPGTGQVIMAIQHGLMPGTVEGSPAHTPRFLTSRPELGVRVFRSIPHIQVFESNIHRRPCGAFALESPAVAHWP